jgi:hypothetical protein
MTLEPWLQRSLHAKHGGVHFTQLAEVQTINDFVRDMPETQRDNLFEVLQALQQAGYIRVENDGEFLNPDGESSPNMNAASGIPPRLNL